MTTNKYIFLKSNENKIWVFHQEVLKYSKNLYHPSTIKGKIIKKFMLLLLFFHPRFLKRVDLKEYINPYIFNEIQKKYQSYKVSLYLGTPCAHQKTTVQLFNVSGIIYIKYSENRLVNDLFKNERLILCYLKKCGVENIPEYIGYGDSPIFYLVQTGLKNHYEKNKWTNKHEKFIEDLFDKTKSIVSFEKSDFNRSLIKLKYILDEKHFEFEEIIRECLELVIEKYRNRNVEFGVCHRDFTPWNISVKDRIFVYDWEYAKMTYPKGIDYFHFLTRTSLSEKRDTNYLWNKYKKSDRCNKENNYTFLEYLLDFSSLYIDRGTDIDILSVKEIIPLINLLYQEIMLDKKYGKE